MRRWVFAFLLLVVPFQLVWGAATPYCAHEATVTAKKHFGHHEHQHQGGAAAAASADADVGEATGAHHADCESCHLACTAFMPAPGPAVLALPAGRAVSQRDPRYESHIPPGPQRPDRAKPTPAARFGGGVVVASLMN